jgi:hypothetical protein
MPWASCKVYFIDDSPFLVIKGWVEDWPPLANPPPLAPARGAFCRTSSASRPKHELEEAFSVAGPRLCAPNARRRDHKGGLVSPHTVGLTDLTGDLVWKATKNMLIRSRGCPARICIGQCELGYTGGTSLRDNTDVAHSPGHAHAAGGVTQLICWQLAL